MNWRAAIGYVCVAPLAGCSLAETAGRNLRNEPKVAFEERHLQHRLHHDAKSTLRAIAQQHPKKVFTDEFRDGFEDGFADYLDGGRIPIPPSIPPLKYRSNKYLNPEGHARIYDWFAGFKYGAEVACATGMRAYYTVPVLTKEAQPPPALNITVLPPPPDGLSTDPKPLGSPMLPDAKPAAPKPADGKPADGKPAASTPLPLPKVVDVAPELPKVPVPTPVPLPTPVPVPDKPKDPPLPVPLPNPTPVPPPPKTSHLPAPAETTPVTAMIPAPVPIPVTVTMMPPPAPVVRPQTGDLLPPPLTATAGK